MVTGIKFKDLIECFHCNDGFERNTGHKMLCPDCGETQNLCNDCYEHLKKEGLVIDKTYNKEELHERVRDKAK